VLSSSDIGMEGLIQPEEKKESTTSATTAVEIIQAGTVIAAPLAQVAAITLVPAAAPRHISFHKLFPDITPHFPFFSERQKEKPYQPPLLGRLITAFRVDNVNKLNAERISDLISEGVDLNVRMTAYNRYGEVILTTPLNFLLGYAHSQNFFYFKPGMDQVVKVAKILIQHSNLDTINFPETGHGNTALHWAIYAECLDLKFALVEKGADTKLLIDCGLTPTGNDIFVVDWAGNKFKPSF
jgi:hypothetical protein